MKRRRKQKGQLVCIGKDADGKLNRWFVRFWEEKNVNGTLMRKRVSRYLGSFAGSPKRPPEAVKEACETYMVTANIGKLPVDRILTVGAFAEIFLRWAECYKRPSTAHSYRQIWNQHLKPLCSEAWLKDVQTHHVQQWLDAIVTNPNRELAIVHEGQPYGVCKGCETKFVLDSESNEPADRQLRTQFGEHKCCLSSSTVRHCKFVLSGMFRYAAQQGYLPHNAANPVSLTDVSPLARRPRETHAYSLMETCQMLGVLPEPARTIVAVCAYTGARIGEVEALRWEDFHDASLYISRSVWRGHLSEPKTQESASPVTVCSALNEILEMHRAHSGFPTTGPMFRTAIGTPLAMGNVLNRQILPVLNRCAICKLPKGKRHVQVDPKQPSHDWQPDSTVPRWNGWHAFRRGVATELQHLGANVVTAQGALRHSNAAVTLKHYTKVVRDDVRISLEKFGETLTNFSLTDSQRTAIQTPGALPKSVN